MNYYAYVNCHGNSVPGQLSCGLVGLTEKQYMGQMGRPNQRWFCHNCGSSASFDDDRFELMSEQQFKASKPLVWTRDEAIELCRLVEDICPEFGCHVAFTGGLLYKEGMRKDADLLFYRIRQIPKINVDGLFSALGEIGLKVVRGFGWVYKALYNDKPVDCFFPEEKKVIATSISKKFRNNINEY